MAAPLGQRQCHNSEVLHCKSIYYNTIWVGLSAIACRLNVERDYQHTLSAGLAEQPRSLEKPQSHFRLFRSGKSTLKETICYEGLTKAIEVSDSLPSKVKTINSHAEK